MLLTLYDRYGSVKASLSPNDTSTQDKEIQGDNVLNLSFTLYEYVGIDVNDYVDFEGERYWAVERYLPQEKSTVEWEYDVKMYGIESLIKRFLVLKTVDGGNEAVFTLTARPIDHMRLIIQSINSGMNTSDWKVGTVEGTDNVVIDYFGKYCDEGLKELAEKVGVEWWIEGSTVNLSRCEHGEELTLAYGAGLTSLDREVAANAKFYTRLFPIGSSRNIDPERYGASRLQLPGGVRYVDVNVERYGIIHHYEQEAFSGIYPRRIGVVSSVRSENVTDGDGKPFTIYYFRDDSLTFDPNDYEIGGLVKHVSFQEGSELAGLGVDDDHYFEVNYNSDTREFEIITIWPYDDDTQLPGGTLVPKVGDSYILWNIRMPDEYYNLAEQEFENAVNEYNSKHALDVSCYKAPTDHVWVEEQETALATQHTGQPLLYVGRRIRLESDEYFPDTGYRPSRITRITRKVALPSQMDLEISDTLSTRALEKINDAISGVRNYTRTQINSIDLPDVIKSWEGTKPTDNNLYSARASHSHFLNKRIADKALEVITFVKGIFVGDGTHGIDEQGNATLNDATMHDATMNDVSMNSAQTPSYSGTDIVSDKGFKVWEDDEGKSHVITDYFTARVKAFFASLEIRKIEHSAGNRIESPAGNTLALVKKFDAKGNEIVDKWYARRYKFAGVNLALKLVHLTGQFFGVWQEDPDAKVAYYRCYWTAEDKEEKKAVVNNWKVGDQAFCQTFNLRNLSGYVSNKRYWRLVENIGYETIEGTEYAYIDLSNTLWISLTADGVTKTCKGYETNGGQNLNDAPEVGDDVACLGNQITPETRGGAIQYITYGEVDDTTGIPCVKTYSGIGSDVDYPFDLDRYLIQKQSPKGVYMRADKFEIVSASGTGSSTLTCERGAWDSNQTYGRGDIVQHHGSTWRCVVAVGTTIKGIDYEPSEGSAYWQVYARRGTSAPQVELDSANAVVSANYEGKISNISQVTGLPTTVEVYVEGNQIPTSDWDMANSFIKWKGKTHVLNGLLPFDEYGVVLYSITINTGNVAIVWEYLPEIGLTPSGTETIHPVINPTDFIAHIEFTYNGETQSADISIPMIVQKAAANVVAQYSADNNSWHSALAATDIYVRYSYDGGTTWTQGTRFVGKSIELDRGQWHFADYGTMWNVLTLSMTAPKFVGYYLCDTDASGTQVATLWHWNGKDVLTNVPITEELNYIATDYATTEAGHLWNADDTSTAWTDLGVIQGADGIDGISVTLDPATVIFEQDENNTSTINGLPFESTIRVWKGTTVLDSSAYSVGYDSSKQDGHCAFNVSGNVVTITALNTDSTTKAPYTSGKVVITVTYNGTPIDLVINWAANLLGTWKMTVKGDVMREVSEKTVSYTNDDGTVTTEQWQSAIEQSSQRISLSAKKDDLETAGIHLDGENSRIDLLADKTQFLRSIDRLPFIKIGVDEDNMPYLIFMMPDGVTEAYNLGYKGLVSLIDEGVKASFSNEVRLVLLGFVDDYLDDGVPCEDLYNGCTDPLSQYFYRYNQTRMKQANGTYVIVPATPNYDGMYYNGNTIDEGNPNRFPVSTLQTLDDISGALEDDITLWVGFRTRLDGWDDTSEPIARVPMINYTATCVLYWVQNSRVIRSEQIAVTRNKTNKSSDNVYFITNSDGSTKDHYIIS